MATLVERMSRFVVLVPLAGGDAATVSEAVIDHVQGLPDVVRRSLTGYCGSEMAEHAAITSKPIFRCTSRIRTRHGNAARTRTPTGGCGSISPKAP
ncbi:hypothetical protein GCM10010182_82440 [Actinomadura cremea]|nr:hypothetical protein GCM10010182_82440 [Actinomadura cremea]